jgi:hypothetical protein
LSLFLSLIWLGIKNLGNGVKFTQPETELGYERVADGDFNLATESSNLKKSGVQQF